MLYGKCINGKADIEKNLKKKRFPKDKIKDFLKLNYDNSIYKKKLTKHNYQELNQGKLCGT